MTRHSGGAPLPDLQRDRARVVAARLGGAALLVLLAIAASLPYADRVGATQDDTGPAPVVLVIYGSFTGFSPHVTFHSRLVEGLNADVRGKVDVRAEFLDVTNPDDEAYNAVVMDYLRRKYPPDRVAAVVGIGAMPIPYARTVRDTLFPSAPFVYGLADRKRINGFRFGANATGVTGDTDITGTVALATRLVPRVARVALVAGPTEVERAWYDRIVNDATAGAPGAEIIPLFGLPRDELMRRLASMPRDTVVVWISYFRGLPGDISAPADTLAEALDTANVPIFGVFASDIGRGVVGGLPVDEAQHGETTGRLVARIVNGEPAGSIPPINIDKNPPTVDWRALNRWHLDPRLLPPDAVVLFREPTAWDAYGWYLVGASAVVLLETLLIAGLVLQRSRRVRSQRTLAERLRFERVVSDLSARFVDLPVEEVDEALNEALVEIRAVFEADRVNLVQFGQDPSRASVVHSATADGIAPLTIESDFTEFRALVWPGRRGDSLQFARSDEIPDELRAVREAEVRRGVRSGIVVPLHAAGVTFGLLRIVTLREPRVWPEDAATRLRMLGEVFANALVRRRAAAELHRSEEMSGAVLNSIAAQVCVLGRDGRILAINDAWRLASGERGGRLSCLLAGEQCPRETGAPCAALRHWHMRGRIKSVLDGSVPEFTAEYGSAAPGSDSWFSLTVEQFRTPEGGAVMTHQNITSRKRAELESEQRRQELAHVSRVTTMGELAASIAHELNQPLTGVLANAQAALRFLAADPPNVGEVREILGDIIDDDRRAGEVIRRLRAMLQPGAAQYAEVDVNELVVAVVKMLTPAATLRQVALVADLADDLSAVRGDRVQLQQVVLNLVVNAMDAMDPIDAAGRRVSIGTAAVRSWVEIAVADRGTGIAGPALNRLFDPFFTTKAEGMGMGLSIARTIVEAHGGSLSAENNPDRGATFRCRIPEWQNGDRVEPGAERPPV